MTRLAKRVWKWVAGLFAGVVIVLAILVGIFRIAVTEAPHYRQPIADWTSDALGLPVEIGSMDARFGLDGPRLVFRDMTVFSADESEALFSLRRGSLSLDLMELLFRWRFKARRLTLEKLDLEVDRSEDGQLLVFDRTLEEFPKREGELPLQDIRIRDARLILRDRMTKGQTWVLDGFDADVSQRRGRLSVEGAFRAPDNVAGPVSFWAKSSAGEIWQAYAHVQGLDLSATQQIPGLPPVIPSGGRCDFRIWLDTDARVVTRVSAEAELTDLVFEFDDSEPVVYRGLEGRLEWDRRPTGWRGRIENLVVRRAGAQWSSDSLLVEKSVTSRGDEGDYLLDADFLRLQDLTPLAPAIPDVALREDLQGMQPSGDVTDLTIGLSVLDNDPAGYRLELRADLDGYSHDAFESIPGIRGLTGQVRSDPQGGRFEMDSRGLALEIPEMFREPLEFDEAQGLVVWSRGLDGLTIIGDGLRAANRDLGLTAGFQIRRPAGEGSGNMEVQATVNNLDLSRKSAYLPVGVMTPNLVRWLDSAIVSGSVPVASLDLRGPTKGFPYADGGGVFEVSFGTRDLVLDYAKGWPAGQGIAADITFRGAGFSALVREGQLGGATVDGVRVDIPVLPQGMLSIEGTAKGSLAAVRDYVLESPLRATIGPALENTRIEAGDTDIRVDLLLPLKSLEERKILVELDISGGHILYGNIRHPLIDTNGTLTVDNQTVRAEGITGVLIGEPVMIDVRPHEGRGTRAYVSGPVTTTSLVDVLGIPMGGYLDGEAQWQGFAHFPAKDSGDRFWIHFESDLQGMEVSLPPPLEKPASAVLPLTIDFRFPDSGLLEWAGEYGGRLSAAARFDPTDDGLRFIAGQILGGGPGAIAGDENGLVIEGEVDRLPIIDWLGVRFGDRREGQLRDLLTRIDLEVDHAFFGGQHFADVGARLEQLADDWLVTVTGETLSGTITVPMNLSQGSPIVLAMDRLYLDDDAEDSAGEEPLDPKSVPSMAVVITDFQTEGLRLGRLEGEILSVPNGFRVERMDMIDDAFTIKGSGHSLLGFGQDSSGLSIEVASSDLGDAMESVGFERTLEANSAEMKVDLQWTGGWPAEPLEVAQGTASLRIKNGSLSEVKPGAGRVFGLLSVQALPRRLTLDFRDVFKKGFFFDELKGDFRIDQGVAYTDNLVFRSPAADIGILGGVDLIGRTYDQTAIVSAEVGNTLPVVGALAVSPVIGAGLFVLKEIFKEPLRGMAQIQYRISGPWETPEVERIAVAQADQPSAEDAASQQQSEGSDEADTAAEALDKG
ncbi:MAG: TIGR02099 family protein [Gammaproteobacteria bacterium]|nr:MAG: TIGR02099 family protein [Gammaproteobacteria bacterium]